jgi:prenyltransferase beta subunit
MMPIKKRVLLSLTKEPYERLQANIKAAGLGKSYFAHELDKIIIVMDQVVVQLMEARKQNQEMKEKEVLQLIQKTANERGMKIKKIEIEDSEE